MHHIARSHLRIYAISLFALQFMNPSWAQEGGMRAPGPHYPSGSEITFQWDYSCPGHASCSFSCPGQGGAGLVTKLTIYLGTIPVGSLQNAPAMFYEFSTREMPTGSGFIVGTGLGSLSCQINGMILDYSGPSKSLNAKEPAKTK